MKLKIVTLNPNSSTEVTASMIAAVSEVPAARRHDVHCTELSAAPIGIETDAHVAEVTPMVEDFAATMEADALVVACFSDPGVAEARRRTTSPVFGIAEAAYVTALHLAPAFGVISLGPSSTVRHAAHIERLGLTARLAGDRAVGMSVAEGNRPEAFPRLADVGKELIGDGAGVLILGCAGMAVHRMPLQAELGVPVIDPVQAAVSAAVALLELNFTDRGSA